MATFDGGFTYTVLAAPTGSTFDGTFTYTVAAPAAETFDDDFTYTVLAVSSISANAGVDATTEALSVVFLNGYTSTGNPETYTWTQTAGTTVTMIDAGTPTPQFTAPALVDGDVLTFQLTVTKVGSADVTDTVSVTVLPHVQWLIGVGGALTPYRRYVITGGPISGGSSSDLSGEPLSGGSSSNFSGSPLSGGSSST